MRPPSHTPLLITGISDTSQAAQYELALFENIMEMVLTEIDFFFLIKY